MKKLSLCLVTAAMIFGTAAQVSGTQIYCNQVGGYYPGIYTFPSEGGTLESVFEYAGLDSKFGGVFTDEAYYSSFSSTYSKYCIRTAHDGTFGVWQTPSRINERLKITDIPTALGWNSINGKVYGSFTGEDETSYFFGTFSTTDGTSTIIAPLEKQLVSIAVNEIGQMFVIDVSGDLSTISTSGELTYIGSTGVTPSPKYAAGATFDPNTGILYWAATTKQLDTALYTVDTATGTATSVYSFPSNTFLTSLVIPETPPVDGAPADVSDFTVLPDGFQNKLDISFTLPTETVGGETMLGAVKYKVMVDTEVIADTQGGPGQVVELSCNPGNGEHVVTLFISNLAGKGHRCVSKIYVGEDNPGAVTGVEISAQGKTITVTWDAPVTGEHGGNFDVSALRYDVVRVNDGVKVADLTAETSFSETVESQALTNYSYTITPKCGSLTGPEVMTESVLVGDGMEPPYEQLFDDTESFDDIYFSTYDANNDGSGWVIYQNYYGTAGNARYEYSADNDADDWLFTCPLVLESGKSYEVEFSLNCSSWGNGERLGLSYGHNPTPQDMTEVAIPDTDYANGFNETVTATIEPTENGSYYLGFHITSAKDSYNVNLDNIKIGAGVATSIKELLSNGVKVRSVKGGIEIETSEESVVTIIDVKTALSIDVISGSGLQMIPLNPGIYVVRINENCHKVLVK